MDWLTSMASHPVPEGRVLGGLWYVVEPSQYLGDGEHAVLARITWHGRIEWGHLRYDAHSGKHSIKVSGPEEHARASYRGLACPDCGVKGYTRDGCRPGRVARAMAGIAELCACGARATVFDPQDGLQCAACEVTPSCDECRVALNGDLTCPKCGASHSGEPCPVCKRRGLHKDDCAYPGDPWTEGGPAVRS